MKDQVTNDVHEPENPRMAALLKRAFASLNPVSGVTVEQLESMGKGGAIGDNSRVYV